jgi:predicted  nucleic acid-binding Zn-ribbon protein
VRHAEADLKEAETSVAKDRKEIQQLHTEKQKQMAAAMAERARTVVPVPGDLLELYTRIAKRHNGTAMAQVKDDQCRGCGMRVLPHIVQELCQEPNEEIYRCEMCGLILYSLEPIPSAKTGADEAKSAATPSANS